MQGANQNSKDFSPEGRLTIGDAAKYLGVSIDTLRRWEEKGRISPARSPGGHRYYQKHNLDKLFGKKYVRDEGHGLIPEESQPTPAPPPKPAVEIPTQQPIAVQQSQPPVATQQPVNQPTPTTPQPQPVAPPKIDLNQQHQQKLEDILTYRKQKRRFPINGIIWTIISVALITLATYGLFLIYQSSTEIISPLP